MTVWTYAQLMGIWVNNGGNKAMAPLMAAVAEVESGGNDQATNPSGATGLWQIEWPLHAGITPCATSKQALLDPNCNAKAAIVISGNVNSTAPGSPVYDNWLEDEPPNAYAQYLNGSTTPDTNVPGGTAGSGGTQATATADANTAACLLGFPGVSVPVVGSVGSFCIISRSEARAVIGALCLAAGGIIAMVGVLIVAAGAFTDTKAGQAATSAVSKAGAVVPFIPM